MFEVEAARDRSDSEATSQPIAHDAARQYARRLVQTLVDKKPDRYLLSASQAGRGLNRAPSQALRASRPRRTPAPRV